MSVPPSHAAHRTVTVRHLRKSMFMAKTFLSPRLLPPPFPMSLRSCVFLDCSHHLRAHYHCGRLWNYQRGPASAREQRRLPETRPGPCSNPVIKIPLWMLILWKKPNDFSACFISEADEKPKSIQQKGSTPILTAGRKVNQSMWGGQQRKKKRGVVLQWERAVSFKKQWWVFKLL